METIDFEVLANELCEKYNGGISISRCDYLKIDEENKQLRLIEETQWWDKGNEKAMDDEFLEIAKKIIGSILLLGLLSKDKESYCDLIIFKKSFKIETIIDTDRRAVLIFNLFRLRLKELKNGVFEKIDIEFLN